MDRLRLRAVIGGEWAGSSMRVILRPCAGVSPRRASGLSCCACV